MEKPFIHLMKTSEHYYVYDVNTMKIIIISEQLYKYFEQENSEADEKIKNEIEVLKARGYLKGKPVRKTKHCETDYLPYYFANKMNMLILQVTRSCNLRCEYCGFSGLYQNRRHEDKFMSWELAKRGIDYLAAHSRDSKMISLSFYGGEPLLAFDLIKKCVSYAEECFEGKKIIYGLTTNGTLLKGEILEFFVEHNFRIMISLDGPEEYHDKFRRFANSGQGSFKVVMNNILNMSEKYPKYYENQVAYNAVLDFERSFKRVNDFVNQEPLFKKSSFSYALIDDNYTETVREPSEEFIRESKYTTFLLYLQGLNRIKRERVTQLFGDKISELARLRMRENSRTELPKEYHHSGPCIAGLFHTFLNLKGEFFSCEKVSEISNVCKVGDIDNGIDVEYVRKLINVGKLTEKYCDDCWACDYCSLCAIHADGINQINSQKLLKECKFVRNKAHNLLLDYCVLTELGFDFEAHKYVERS